MSKEIYISSTPHETRLAIVETDELTEIYYERENEYTLAGSIYNGKVTRVLPGMQSSFVDVGLERDAFLYITDFMEEAGDAADFEGSESRGRSDGRRNDRTRETQRDDAPLLAESPAPESGDSRPADRGDSRPSDRGDRGRRRRGGNRDGRDTQPRDLASREAQPRDLSPIVESQPPLQAVPSVPQPGNISSDPEAEMGEGAPGADGSRRWRGRRGRRRGRSGNRDLAVPGQAGAVPDGTDLADLPPDPSAGYDLEDNFSDTDLDASAEVSQPTPPAPVLREDSVEAERPLRSDAGDRGERSREARDGNRGRRDRGGRGRGEDRPRAPRGFAPSRALYGVDEAAEQREGAEAAPLEPIILPGESLSKYRKDAGTAPSGAHQAAPAVAQPAAEFALPGVWDGGSVLPGETIRPRSSSTDRPQTDVRHEGRRDDRGRSRTEDRRGNRRDDYRTPPATRSHDLQASHAVVPLVPFREERAPVAPDSDGLVVAMPPEAEMTLHELAPELPTREEQPLSSAADAAESSEKVVPETDEEPTAASASHRFDPLPVREFRQPSAEIAEPAERIAEPAEESVAMTHSITPPAGTPLAPLHREEPGNEQEIPSLHLGNLPVDTSSNFAPARDVHTHDSDHSAEAPAAHDLTSINSDGEMLSQAPAPPPESDVAEPTSPLQHETAVLQAAAGSDAVAEPEPTLAQPATRPEVSEEADDLIVEELSEDGETDGDEEDFQTTTLHAASIEEMDYDDDEEETLEGAADLGTMLREMSIDEITQPADPGADDGAEDDFAFEEEDSVEDAEYSAAFAEGESSREADGESEDRFAEESDERDVPQAASGASPTASQDREDSRRRGGRRDGRRSGRDRDRGSDRSSDRSPRAAAGGSGDRDRSFNGRPGRREGHRSAQTTNLPAISDLLKPGQEVLVQIAKEPIAKKGARITSHIALPGRFLVFMPTVNHTGVSRKIESDGERRRLKEILLSEKGEASGGFIVRTAASGASEEELRSDLRFLLNLWADIKQRSESSKSPALIYHDLNLVERVLRDQVTDNFSAIWVDTETEYERVLRFLQRFQPSLIRRVKLYTKETPLFEQFGITEEINKALRSKVWLKSGGSIVINQTEALVAIDINTGKYVGKTARLEDTIVKTNLDAIPEIVRQIRLRDLGGIIIIDFIDMDERKNRHKVMAVLEEELKKDRAPSKVLQFNDFGLVAITRKRVKQSLERTLSTTCGICAGTGMVKSAVTVCNDIYVEMRKMQKHLDRSDVMLRVNPEVVKQLKSPTAKWLQEMEEMIGKTILVKSDPALHPEQFDIH